MVAGIRFLKVAMSNLHVKPRKITRNLFSFEL